MATDTGIIRHRVATRGPGTDAFRGGLKASGIRQNGVNGSTVVRHWTGLAFERGPAQDAIPRAASRRTLRVPVDDTLGAAIGAALADVQDPVRQRACTPRLLRSNF